MNPGWQFICALFIVLCALWQSCFGPSLLRELAASYFRFGCRSLIAMRPLEGGCDEARVVSGLDAFGCKVLLESPLMLRSHQIFCSVLVAKLLGIIMRNRCWPTTFHTITAGDADGWCQKQPVWLASQALISPNFMSGFSCENVDGLSWEIEVGPPLFTLL